MALATQCPHCYTSFRVANDQLKLHAGMVRCGACKQTFNGIEHLLAPGATAKTPPVATPTPNATPATEEKEASEIITAEVMTENADAHAPLASQSTDEAKNKTTTADDNFIVHGSDENSDEGSVKGSTEDSNEFSIEPDQNSDAPQLELSAIPIAIEAGTKPDSVEPASDTFTPSDEHSKPISSDSAQTFANNDADRTVNLTNQAKNIPAATVVADQQLSDSDAVLNLNTTSSPTSAISATEVAQKQAAEPSFLAPSESNLEIPEPEKSEPSIQADSKLADSNPTESKPSTKQNTKRPASLTANLDFELSKEDREWVDELAHIHQLELETRAAVLDEASNDWSKHETPSVQDGFIDSLKDLKPILDDITAASATSDLPTTKTKHQTLNDLRVSGGRDKVSDSLTDQQDSFNDTVVHDPEVTPAFVLQAERAQRFGKWKRYGLGFGVFLFTLLGLAQSAYFLRSDIAAQVPQLKPQLLSICKVLSCQIKLPAQKSLLEITGSELLIVNEELSMNTLSVQIQNKSGTVQAWPHFDLALKDRRGKDLLQKAFSPSQYLDNKDLLNKGMAANSETNHKIFFQLNGLKASDYTVEIFYP